MMVTFVSQCEKKALNRTRRVLDAFADRIGDNTWQTVITQEGLLAVKKLLRRTATKNTAVSCHWIRSRSRSELVWVVGNRRRFDEQGRVPVNTTARDLLKLNIENNWHCGETIKLLAQMAALLHDLGKASIAFQHRLQNNSHERNLYRHEWVSLRLFTAFVGDDDDSTWLLRMLNPNEDDHARWTAPDRFFRDGIDEYTPPPFQHLPPLASAIAWLVVTHHRLPVSPSYNSDSSQNYLGKPNANFKASQLPNILKTVTADWNELHQSAEPKHIGPYWSFAKKQPFELPRWRKRLAKLAEKLLVLHTSNSEDWTHNPYVMHLSRLCLMLADHYYSSLPPESSERERGDNEDNLFANTHHGKPKQSLTEHLLGVARFAGHIAHALPLVERQLPKLAGHNGLKKRAGSARFRWQDKAADAAEALREQSEKSGAFIVNMASTGCGKTLANARILYALAQPQQGMRAIFALGLRTLTLQTGRAYRDDLHLDDDELAILVGGTANKKLFEYYEAQAEQTGSASAQALLEEDGYIEYEGLLDEHPVLSKVLAEPKINRLIAAPVLVCTIDHLMPATEAQRAGRQIAPMLRLMSSDLVLDELDDFDINDLPALTRLVHWAGLLGTRVVLSSATLPPALVYGMYQAYLTGRQQFNRNRSAVGSQDSSRFEVPCLWVDEFNTYAKACQNQEQLLQAHNQFIKQRVSSLHKSIITEGAKRRGTLIPLNLKQQKREQVATEFSKPVLDTIIQAHNTFHEQCPHSGKRVSFGLVRMANIEPLIDTAKALFASECSTDFRLHIRVYHSRFPLALRSAIEHQLDTTLNRRQPDEVFERADIRRCLDENPEQNHVFVVLGSPVTEVGRDHDYDWAIVEPSSMRSLIQLAGRVQRHREKSSKHNQSPNIFIFNKNLRAIYSNKTNNGEPEAVFIKPGFEMASQAFGGEFRLVSHRLDILLQEHEYQHISSIPRIHTEHQPLQPQKSLVDLEHRRMEHCMLPTVLTPGRRGERAEDRLNAASYWQYPQASLTWVLPQHQPFRLNQTNEETLLFLLDDDEEQLQLWRVHEQARKGKSAVYTQEQTRFHPMALHCASHIDIWGEHDLMAVLTELAQAHDLSLQQAAERFSTVQVNDSTKGWTYHPALGFGHSK